MSVYDETQQFVLFKIANQLYGIDIQTVQIIERVKSTMRVPKTARWIKGVLNLRGEIIPVIDLAILFGVEEREITESARIIIVKVEEMMVGFIVNSVKEVVNLDTENVEGAPSVQGKLNSQYIQGVGKIEGEEAIVTLLNLSAIIDEAFQV